MKQLLLCGAGILITLMINAQPDRIEALFNKYSGQEGITTVYISSKMFSLFADKEYRDTEADRLISNLSSIKILSVEDAALNAKLNFVNELFTKSGLPGYKELMVVKEADSDVYFLIKEKGIQITELLVITSGKSGNSIISIRGNMTMGDISSLSKSIGIQELQVLDSIGKK